MKVETDIAAIAQGLLAGERAQLARALRLVDDRPQRAHELLGRIYHQVGNAHVLGVTGNPGAGKSTLSDQLIRHFRSRGEKVAVLAIDPSSPFSGGAILGDRIRMAVHTEDEGVFIRSLATRGTLGGLSASTYNSIVVLDAAGFDRIIVETVGVGQDEVDIARTAHTTLVTLVPGMGDDIQSIKAGLLEIADIFVLNKADRQGVEQAEADLHIMLTMLPEQGRSSSEQWRPSIHRTVALYGDGIPELCAAIDRHRQHIHLSTAGQRRLGDNQRYVFEAILQAAIVTRAMEKIGPDKLQSARERATDRGTDPYALTQELLDNL